jgi:glycosyltransferase involved in cell wall biosynthesis
MIPKKILHICVGLNQGGIEAILYRLISNTNTNIEHVVLCFRDEGFYGPKFENLGIKVIYLRCKKRKFGLKSFYSIYKTIKEMSPDIVNTWWYPADVIGGLAAKMAGVKNIYWGIFSANFQFKYIGIGTILFLPFNVILSHIIPRKIISCTNEGIRLHKKYGYNKNKLLFIPPGIDTEKFAKKSFPRKSFFNNIEISDKTFVISCIARWDPLKDHQTLLTALSYYIDNYDDDILFILCGSNVDDNNLELLKIITKLGISNKNVTLLGNYNNIVELFHFSDINILTSVGEGFPNVIIESMSCGTPCIATKVGDSEFAINEFGWTVNIKNYKQIAKNINEIKQKIAIDKTYVYKIGENARNYVKDNFTITKMCNSYLNTWLEK